MVLEVEVEVDDGDVGSPFGDEVWMKADDVEEEGDQAEAAAAWCPFPPRVEFPAASSRPETGDSGSTFAFLLETPFAFGPDSHWLPPGEEGTGAGVKDSFTISLNLAVEGELREEESILLLELRRSSGAAVTMTRPLDIV